MKYYYSEFNEILFKKKNNIARGERSHKQRTNQICIERKEVYSKASCLKERIRQSGSVNGNSRRLL